MKLEKVTVARADGQGQVGHFRSPSADTYLQLNVNVELNRTYTLHGYIKSAANGTLSCLGKSVGTTTSWNHFSMQIVPDSKIFSLVFSPGEYWFYNFKLEKGTIMTQWTPNGEDLVVVKQNIVSMGSSINQLNDKITQKVWMTEVNAAKGEVNAHLTNVEQTANKIDWLVKSGTDSSNMVLTDNAYSLIAKNIDLKGNATFSSFLDTSKTYINGGKIATGSITADQIAAGAITAEKIASKTITADKISVDDLSAFNANIAGFEFDNSGLLYTYSNYTFRIGKGIASSSDAIAVKNNGTYKFYLQYDGKLYAKNADISGTITSASINNGNGTFKVDTDGTITATKGKIGNFSIDNHQITSQVGSSTSYICMDYSTDSLISKSGSYTAKLNSGALRFFNNEAEMAVYQTNKWKSTNIWGTCVHSSVDSKFVTFGNLKTPSSQMYETVLLLNYGLNPDGITNDVIVYGDSYFMDRAQFKNGIEFINAVDNTRTVFIPCDGGGVDTTSRFGVKGIYENYTFSVDGNGYASSGFTSGSDKRLKHNIEKMTDDFEKIVDFLSPSSYVYNSSTNEKKHLGFIAQEVQQAFSNCNINPNDYEIVNDRGDGMLSLTYDDLISILWKACQSLRKDNKEIKRQLSSLQNQISSQGLAIQQQSLDN